MTNNINSLHTLITEVKNDNILLPDFQRKFVWTDVERKQKRLVASVLSWLPIGSLLLLEGESKEFVAKKLGRKTVVEQKDFQNKKYLLDGQQRLTVLTNVFSNTIFENLDQWNNLSSDSLKNRFFMKFDFMSPADFAKKIDENKLPSVEDIFGISNLRFPFDPSTDEPQFLTEDVYDYVEAFTVKANDKYSPFHPQYNFSSSNAQVTLASMCHEIDNASGYSVFRVPLFLVVGSQKAFLNITIDKLISTQEAILMDVYNSSSHSQRVSRFTKLFPDSDQWQKLPNDFAENIDSFSQFLKLSSVAWSTSYKSYLEKCVGALKVNVMIVNKAQRARAIDIYENLNQGGVSLDTFDLIIAKAAKVMSDGFYDAFIKAVKKDVDVPVFYEGYHDSSPKWNANTSLSLYNEDKNLISSTYIDVFLNLLSLVNNVALLDDNGRNNIDLIKLELIKKEEILALSPEKIVNTYQSVAFAINRALAFLQLNCGVRKLDDISYDHVLLTLSYFFYFDDIYESKNKSKILEFWYWSSILSGVYDKDQNTNVITDLKLLTNVIFNNIDKSILTKRKDVVFNLMYFSDKGTLLLDYADQDRLPKDVIRKTICQYILKNKPKDVLEDVSLNSWDDMELDYHHIIPLKAAIDIKESTAELRKDKKSILNSPLNFTLITKKSNINIGAYSIDTYFESIKRATLSSHFLPEAMEIAEQDNAREWLEERYIRIKTEFERYLDKLIAEF